MRPAAPDLRPAAGPRPLRRRAALVALLALLGARVAEAQPDRAPRPAGPPVSVTIDLPNAFEPAYGRVVFEAVAVSEQPIERVVFYVDSLVVGETRKPPHRVEVDLGDDLDVHRFEVIAYGADGTIGSASITTPGMRIDDRISIRLQQLYVTVTRDGEGVDDLDATEFAIFEGGERQRLVTFARGDIPFTAAVLLDSSSSMAGAKLRSALAGASLFFERMQRLDEGKLIVFSDRILHATPFTTFPEVLAAGLGRVRAEGGTALNDHLYLALKQLEQRQGRRVVILLSDGVDSHSVLDMAAVQRLARRSQALIYWLRLPYRPGAAAGAPPALTTAWRDSAGYARELELLAATVEDSGGRVLDLPTVDRASAAFAEILAELRAQYVLGYYPRDARRDGRWRKVEVRVDRRGVEVRSRGGYIDQ